MCVVEAEWVRGREGDQEARGVKVEEADHPGPCSTL